MTTITVDARLVRAAIEALRYMDRGRRNHSRKVDDKNLAAMIKSQADSYSRDADALQRALAVAEARGPRPQRYQLWQGNGCVVDNDVGPSSDNSEADFLRSCAYWLKEEPSAEYKILIGDECIGD